MSSLPMLDTYVGLRLRGQLGLKSSACLQQALELTFTLAIQSMLVALLNGALSRRPSARCVRVPAAAWLLGLRFRVFCN